MKLPDFHFKRYRQIAALLWKYGRSEPGAANERGGRFRARQTAFGGRPAADGERNGRRQPDFPEHLADDLEAWDRPTSSWGRCSPAARICYPMPT